MFRGWNATDGTNTKMIHFRQEKEKDASDNFLFAQCLLLLTLAIVLSLSEGCNISLHLSGDRGNTSLLWADLSIVRGPGYTLLAEFAASYNITLILDWNTTHIEYQLLLPNVSFICSCLFIHYDGSICHIDAINQIIPQPGHPHPGGLSVGLLIFYLLWQLQSKQWPGDPDYWPNKLLSYDTNIPPDISTLTRSAPWALIGQTP